MPHSEAGRVPDTGSLWNAQAPRIRN